MDPKLVYDVGVHRGDDTAYYLHMGFRDHRLSPVRVV